MSGMKDSGVEWIGQIPNEWAIRRFKELAKIENGRDYKDIQNDNGPYPVFGSGGQFERASEFLYDQPSVLLGRKGTIDRPLYVDHPFWTVDTMYYTRVYPEVDPKFLYYVCTQIDYSLYQYGSAVPSMTQRDLNNIFCPYPGLDVQRLISGKLDDYCSIIDSLIEKIHRHIELFEEYKKTVITEAVTKGLDPNVSMKDSGIEWIRQIPEHWSYIRIKYLVGVNEKVLPETTDKDYNFSYVDIGCVSYEHGIENYEEMAFGDAPSRARRLVSEGDVIISTVRTYLRAVSEISHSDDVVVSTGFAVLSPKSIEKKYLKYAVLNEPFIAKVESRSFGVSYPAITANQIMNISIPLPPKSEQDAISEELDSTCNKINQIISGGKQQIERLSDYRKSLVYEYVTGKKQVEVEA